MANSSLPVRLIVNRTGQPPTILDLQIEPTWTVDQVIQTHVAPAAGERTRLIFLGRILDGNHRLASYLGAQRPSSSATRRRGPAATADTRESTDSSPGQAPCTIHAHISREPVQAAQARGGADFSRTDFDDGDSSDWSSTVLRITSCIILSACWYHRSICPGEYNAVSTGILCAFTAMYLFFIRHLLYTFLGSRFSLSRQGTGRRNV